MRKKIKIFLIIIIGIIALLLLSFLIIKPQLYYKLNLIIGSQIQWYGYEESGNTLIQESFDNLDYINGQLYHAMSVQNTKNGNYDQAIAMLEQAVSLSPKDSEGYYGWVLLYYYKDYKKALFHLSNYDSYTPDFTDYVGDDNILYAKGLCHKNLGNYDLALNLIDEAINYEKNKYGIDWVSHNLFFQRGRVLHLTCNYEEAILSYDIAFTKWSGASEALYYKGLAQIDIGMVDEGCVTINQAYELLKQGLKTTDSYVDLFDEVYLVQVKETLKKLCIITK